MKAYKDRELKKRGGAATMLKIGEFSKLTQVSVRMLRHYDEIGLLKPAETDRLTDYRYYKEEQLPAMCRIKALKDMGFSLADIIRIMQLDGDNAALDDFLESRRAELCAALAETEYKLKLIDIAKSKLRKEEKMKYNPTIKTFPARYAATLRTIIPRYEDKGTVWALLCRETDPLNMSPADPCLCGVTFLDGEYKEKDVEVEAWKTVKGSYADTEHVRFRTLPEVTVVSCTCKGGYEQIGEVNTAILEWIAATVCRPNGPMFNIYHANPHETSNPEEFITEVCYPIEKR